MAVEQELVDLAMTRLQPFGAVRSKKMFGGAGVYLDEAMIVLVDDGAIFLKAAVADGPDFEALGGQQWSYLQGENRVYGKAWTLPDDVWDDPERLRPWIERARAAVPKKKKK